MISPVALDDITFHPDILAKARAYLLARKVTRGGPGEWHVQGVMPEPYRVLSDANGPNKTASFCVCDCLGVLDLKGWSRCAHAVVVLLVVRDGIQVPLEPL